MFGINQQFKLVVVDTPTGQKCDVVENANNVTRGTLVQVHPSSGGDKIAGNYPGLDGELFTVDGDNHIVDG